MKRVFFDKANLTFVVLGVHDFTEEDERYIEITQDQHQELLSALNQGCLIFDDLTYSAPRPDHYHTWNGKAWVMTEESQAQKEADEREVQIAQAEHLREEARRKIDDLQTRIKYRRYKSDADLAAMQAQIEALTIYRMDLEDFINGDLEQMPASPS